MAQVVKIGWIQLENNSAYHINIASTGLIVNSTARQGFHFVIDPKQHGAYGLLVTDSYTHAVMVTGSTAAGSYAVSVGSMPVDVVTGMPITITPGSPLPVFTNPNHYLLAISRNTGYFDIKSKQLSTLAGNFVFTARGLTAPNNDIAASTFPSATPDMQRWIFENQLSTATKFATSSGAALPHGAEPIGYISPQKECVSDVSFDIVDGEWIAVSDKKYGSIHAGVLDPAGGVDKCYQFTMIRVPAASAGSFDKDRNELCHCFTRLSDFLLPQGDYLYSIPPVPPTAPTIVPSITDIQNLMQCKYIYSMSPVREARCKQSISTTPSHMKYSFKIYLDRWVGSIPNTKVIFAQWHGMPNSLFFNVPSTPPLPPYSLDFKSPADANTMWTNYDFKKGISTIGHGTTPQYRYVEQGGKPPLAIKFSKGKLKVVCTGDARYFSGKYIAGTNTAISLKTLPPSEYLNQTLNKGSKKFLLSTFPLGVWVKFDVDVTWATFNRGATGVHTNGSLKVDMEYTVPGASKTMLNLVNNPSLMIGRNDALGYYFKFGCYRHSTEPVSYYMKDYKQP